MQLFNTRFKFLVLVRVNSFLYAVGEKETTVRQTSTVVGLFAVYISVLCVRYPEIDS
jgi:hypothetical protein